MRVFLSPRVSFSLFSSLEAMFIESLTGWSVIDLISSHSGLNAH
jgi:hypothetical protein